MTCFTADPAEEMPSDVGRPALHSLPPAEIASRKRVAEIKIDSGVRIILLAMPSWCEA
jgi:hypothetical protein